MDELVDELVGERGARRSATCSAKGPGGDPRPFELWIYEGPILPPPDADPEVRRPRAAQAAPVPVRGPALDRGLPAALHDRVGPRRRVPTGARRGTPAVLDPPRGIGHSPLPFPSTRFPPGEPSRAGSFGMRLGILTGGGDCPGLNARDPGGGHARRAHVPGPDAGLRGRLARALRVPDPRPGPAWPCGASCRGAARSWAPRAPTPSATRAARRRSRTPWRCTSWTACWCAAATARSRRPPGCGRRASPSSAMPEDDRQRRAGDRLRLRLRHRAGPRRGRGGRPAHDGRVARPGHRARGDGPQHRLDRGVRRAWPAAPT